MAKVSGIELLKKTAVSSFWNTFLPYPDPFDMLVDVRQSTQSVDTYTWFGAPPMPEEWIGDANIKGLPEQSQTIENKAWANGVRVDKKTIKFEQWAEVAKTVGGLGAKAAAHKAKKLSALVEAGFTTGGESYDGQYFFDDDHTDPGAEYTTSQDNDLTTSIVDKDAPTAAELAASINLCVDALYGFKDSAGDPFGDFRVESSDMLVVMVPTNYASAARSVLMDESLSADFDNNLRNSFDLRVNRWLTNTDYFYCFLKGLPHKPMILQEAGGVQLEDSIGSADYVNTGDVVYRASWWGETGYGEWRTAVAMIHTTT